MSLNDVALYDFGAVLMVALVAVTAVACITSDAIERRRDAKGRNEHGRRVVAQGNGPMAPWGVET